MLKKVFHFSAGRFTSKNREISLTTNVIYPGCCQCFLYLYAKCFISPTSAIELNTKNKLAAPPQFRFCFCCYHHPIFWKFVTLILMGTKSYFFFDCTGRSAKEGGKERKKGEVGYSHKKFFYSGTSFDKEYWAFSFAFGVELD